MKQPGHLSTPGASFWVDAGAVPVLAKAAGANYDHEANGHYYAESSEPECSK